ncbi:MAG: MBL fold metallo-hydrolase [Mobilicoccus sp.]|nr:MBL fold metallo-hydrolase [Mobilicoccus sp.]
MTDALPAWIEYRPRPFPDANFLLLHGARPALVDSGFVAHAHETHAWVSERVGGADLVVNTHWHADHVGGNGLFQQRGSGIAAAAPDHDAINRRDPGCCVAEYLDQPVAPYTVDIPLRDGDRMDLGEATWEIIATPGHTAGHLALWQPEAGVLVVGDAVSTYDVGWVALALDGTDATATAMASLERMADLPATTVLPAHGPAPTDVAAFFAKAHTRASRLVDDPDGAVWYGARRILAYALMIRDGIPTDAIEEYLLARAWVRDAARLLRRDAEGFVDELVRGMVDAGAVVLDGGRLKAAADHTLVDPYPQVPWPRSWPDAPATTPEPPESQTTPEETP